MTNYHSLVTNQSQDSFILTTTNYQYNTYKKPPKHPLHPALELPQFKTTEKRQQTKINTTNYNRSLRRSFSRAKLLAFFNPDLTHFITFTYKGTTHTPEQVQQHIKQLILKQKRKYSQSEPLIITEKTNTTVETKNPNREPKKRPNPKRSSLFETTTQTKTSGSTEKEHKNKANSFKYIYVMEYQKRGSIHVHMIANDWLETESLRKNKLSVKWWDKGFSDVKSIESFDTNFKPYLYLFKYMHKTERIGASFIHTSRNIDKLIKVDYRDYIDKLKRGNAFYEEDYEFIINERTARISKQYYKTPKKIDMAKEKEL